MPGHLFVVNLNSDTGLEKDSVTNSFAVAQSSEPTGSDLGTIATAIANFYNEPYTGTAAADSVGHYLSPALSSSALGMEIRTYRLDDSELDGSPHGSPLYTNQFTLSRAPGGTALPSEVAFVATLEGVGRASSAVETAGGATRPKQRKTGRLFIGPLGSNAITLVGSIARPTPAFATAVRENVKKLDDTISALGAIMGLGVWSRSDAAIYPLEAVSTDDAFDTQRRRGESPTARVRLAIASI